MAAKNERAPIYPLASAAPETPSLTVSARFADPPPRPARLIGHWIAREEFEQRHSQKTKGATDVKKRKSRHDDPS
jgi:hypothetical protein